MNLDKKMSLALCFTVVNRPIKVISSSAAALTVSQELHISSTSCFSLPPHQKKKKTLFSCPRCFPPLSRFSKGLSCRTWQIGLGTPCHNLWIAQHPISETNLFITILASRQKGWAVGAGRQAGRNKPAFIYFYLLISFHVTAPFKRFRATPRCNALVLSLSAWMSGVEVVQNGVNT